MATSNYNFTLPVVNGSDGVWGDDLNANWTDLDGELKAVSDVADAALPKAGGTMTGPILVENIDYTVSNEGSGLSGALELDLSLADFFAFTLGGNATLSFSNPPVSGRARFFTVEITGGGANTVTWPNAVDWEGGVTPVQTTGKDVYVLYTRDGGASYVGGRVLEDVS